jgi:hypothetical protein
MPRRQLHFAQRDAGVEGGHDERGAQHVWMDVAEAGPFADRPHPPMSGAALPDPALDDIPRLACVVIGREVLAGFWSN